MGTRMGWSLVATAVVLVIWAALLVFTHVRYASGRPTAAVRLAESLRIGLPPESADRLERRLHRRAVVTTLIVGPCFAAWNLWFFYNELLVPESEFRPSKYPPQVLAMPVWALIGVALAAGHLYDLMRSSREPGTRVARIVTPRPADAVPRILTWLMRATGLCPALAAGVWLLAPASVQHDAHAARPHPLLYAAAAVLGPLCVVATELAQRWILNGRQNAATPGELAFDDALRVQAMLAIMIAPVVVCITLAVVVVAPLSKDFDWSGRGAVTIGMLALLTAIIGLPGALQSKWAQRHYLKRFAAYSAAPPLSAPPQVAPWNASC
jgi:hypothetical protein